ncbi:MAG: hypothetical protein QOK28_2622 [Actinomycetota bacterium]
MDPVDVLLIGTFHLQGGDNHVHNADVDDMLSPRRLAEIDEVVAGLARFEPTAVAVEFPCDMQETLDGLYRRYCDGTLPPQASEVFQFGMRVARDAGHQRVLAIDVQEPDWWDEGFEEFVAADPERTRRWQAVMDDGDRSNDEESALLATSTVRDVLAWINSPEHRRAALGDYLHDQIWLNELGNWIGADMVARWFQRNMRIAAALDRLAQPGDRVLVIYGGGHTPLLDYFWRWNKTMRVADPLPYLRD